MTAPAEASWCWDAALTSHKILQDLLQHLLQDLWVGDGVEQLPFLRLGEDDVS